MCMCVYVCVCTCMCVCVSEREREREKCNVPARHFGIHGERLSVCVSVDV